MNKKKTYTTPHIDSETIYESSFFCTSLGLYDEEAEYAGVKEVVHFDDSDDKNRVDFSEDIELNW